MLHWKNEGPRFALALTKKSIVESTTISFMWLRWMNFNEHDCFGLHKIEFWNWPALFIRQKQQYFLSHHHLPCEVLAAADLMSSAEPRTTLTPTWTPLLPGRILGNAKALGMMKTSSKKGVAIAPVNDVHRGVMRFLKYLYKSFKEL